MRFPWVKAPESEPTKEPLSLEERVKALETRQDTLQMDWEDVLSKIARRAGRDAARAKADLMASLDRERPAVVPGANGTVEPGTEEYSGPPGLGMLRGPSKDELRRRLAGSRRA